MKFNNLKAPDWKYVNRLIRQEAEMKGTDKEISDFIMLCPAAQWMICSAILDLKISRSTHDYISDLSKICRDNEDEEGDCLSQRQLINLINTYNNVRKRGRARYSIWKQSADSAANSH